MTREHRGFDYALDGVRSVTGWKVDALTLDLAVAQCAVDVQQRRVAALQHDFATGRLQLAARRQTLAVLDTGAERTAHVYLLQLQQALALAAAQLRQLQQEADGVRTALLEARRFADALDEDRAGALAEHDLHMARRQFADADDCWLQRQHGRKTA